MDTQPSITKNKFYILLLLVLSSLSVIVLLATTATQYFINYINSDYLYLYETANNIIHYHSIAGQNFPAAPYFFPDLFVTIILQFFLSNITLINFINSILFLCVFFILTYNLIQTCLLNKMLSLFGALFALIICFFNVPETLQYLRHWSASHLSVILFCLYLLNSYLQNKSHQSKTTNCVILFILTFLMFISDNLLFAQALLPLSIIIALDIGFLSKNKKSGIYFLILFLLVTLIGAHIDIFLETYFNVSYSLNESLFRIRRASQLAATLKNSMQIFFANISLHYIYYSALFAYDLISALFFTLICKHKPVADNKIKMLTIILGYFYVAQFINPILAILCGKFTGVGRFRYLDTIHIFPALALTITLLICLQKRFYVKSIFIMITVILSLNFLAFININFSLLKNINFEPPYSNFVKCLDELQNNYPIKNGVAEFWDVKEIRDLSKRKIMITQVDRDFHVYNFIDNSKLCYSNPNNKTPYEYQFIIITPNTDIRTISKGKIRQSVGEPDKILFCTNREIWLYTKTASQQRLNQYLHTQV